MPSRWSTFFSTAARRARVSRFPRPASTRRRVRSVSSSVRLPELPEARMETRKPIVSPRTVRCDFWNHRRAGWKRQRRNIGKDNAPFAAQGKPFDAQGKKAQSSPRDAPFDTQGKEKKI